MGDYRTTTGQSLPAPRRERHRRIRLGLLLVILLLAAAVTAGVMLRTERYIAAVGYVTTERHAEVRAAISGTVARILVDSGEVVEPDEAMVTLDSTQEQAALEEAQAVLRKTQAEVARRQIEIAEKKRALAESISVVKLRLANTDKKLSRSKQLLQKGLMSGSVVEDLELEREIAESELNSLQARDLSLFDRELEVLQQEIEARKEAIRQAEWNVARRAIRAPIGGQILRYEFTIGELVTPQRLLYEIFGGPEKILKLKVAERYAAKVAVGQACTAVLAPYRGNNEIVFDGKVEKLRNVIQGEGEKTYRVAYCSFESRGMPVPPGTTAQARIYYGSSSWLGFLFGTD